MNRSSKSARIGIDFIPQEAQIAQRQAIFTRLVRRHEWGFTCFARRLGGNEDRAPDLVQDTLVRAYRAFLSGRLREEAVLAPGFSAFPPIFLAATTSIAANGKASVLMF